MPSIIFVNPPLTTQDRYGVKFQSGGKTPPFGLTTLAAVTRQHGLATEILDAEAMDLTVGQTAAMLIGKSPDYIGFTSATLAITKAARIAELVKKSRPQILMLVGGSHITALPAETFQRFPVFDIGCIGEGEKTIIELLDALALKKDLASIKGLYLRSHGSGFFTGEQERITNLDTLPYPAWDLLPDLATHYCPPVHTLKKIPAALIVASRGCPGRCMFCDRSMFGNHGTFYSAPYLLELVRQLYHTYGIREIQFRDDNFTAFRKRLMEFCRLLTEDRLDLVWSCAGRIDMINEEILKVMKDAGCWQIWYGIESGSQRILDLINKKTTLPMIRQSIELTARAGIHSCGFFMIAHPTETTEEIEQTIRFATTLPIQEAHFSITTPFPGSELYRRAHEFGSFDDNWDKMNGWVPLFVPSTLTPEDIRKYSAKAFRRFYFRPAIVFEYFKKIRSLRHLKIYFFGLLALLNYILLNFVKRMKKQRV
jgi:radical SAM superfamily enzyme YgiQ (UPF0313 family)